MKKLILLLISLLVVGMVGAIEQPPIDNENLLQSVSQPVPPDTGTEGECTPYEIKDRTCDGNVAFYMQCTQSVSGGKWKQFSTDCEQYEKVCSMGQCMSQSEAGMFGLSWNVIIIIGLIIFIIIMMRRK